MVLLLKVFVLHFQLVILTHLVSQRDNFLFQFFDQIFVFLVAERRIDNTVSGLRLLEKLLLAERGDWGERTEVSSQLLAMTFLQ